MECTYFIIQLSTLSLNIILNCTAYSVKKFAVQKKLFQQLVLEGKKVNSTSILIYKKVYNFGIYVKNG